MASKYDEYWIARLGVLAESIAAASRGAPSTLPVTDLRELGERDSWYGTATVHGDEVLQGSMAHVLALAKIVARQHLCDPAEGVFRFTVGANLKLTIRVDAEPAGTLVDHSKRVPRVPSEKSVALSHGSAAAAEAACGVIHELLDSLPRFAGPADIPIDDGLYFFYERGESTRHTSGARVVRVGNHPRSAGRLKARLRDHYRESRGAKNGSVFRRYLGGALLRRSDADSPCLAPSPGAGHWERQNESTCHACAGVEHLVSSTLREQFFLRALRVTDTQERNRLEGLLIATIAACPICRPSRAWLGSFAYPELVRQTGVWNTEFVGGPLMNENDLSRFRELVGESRGRMPQTDDLSRTLLVIPCSGGKAGHRELGLPIVSLSDFVDESSQRLLEEGRELAFQRPGTKLDRGSPLRPALEYYSGQPYKTEGVRDALVAAIMRGLHCVIVSGGYGVVRAEEPIRLFTIEGVVAA